MKVSYLKYLLLLCLSFQVFASSFDETKAFADQGHALAQYNLGIMYENGQGVLQNYNIEYSWVLLAAFNGANLDIDKFPFEVDGNKAQAIGKKCLESNYTQCDLIQ